ncbi:hypothetical protein RvY_09103 [Ramazzottius varieornatus]|uniref:Uncharacterized protein n=1 Tax=Ramazzottius varieornatus TaxID=947166 RepID=A0A1D1VDR0_RAMVA|nr:hypothetical protein RvY_09103 [Ramazzottius varieornatus]
MKKHNQAKFGARHDSGNSSSKASMVLDQQVAITASACELCPPRNLASAIDDSLTGIAQQALHLYRIPLPSQARRRTNQLQPTQDG